MRQLRDAGELAAEQGSAQQRGDLRGWRRAAARLELQPPRRARQLELPDALAVLGAAPQRDPEPRERAVGGVVVDGREDARLGRLSAERSEREVGRRLELQLLLERPLERRPWHPGDANPLREWLNRRMAQQRTRRAAPKAPGTRTARPARKAAPKPKVLAVDVGGSHVKALLEGESEHRRFESGPGLTPEQMVEGVRGLVDGWSFDRVSVGDPDAGARRHADRRAGQPRGRLGRVRLRRLRFGMPTKVVNDAVMQAIGSYEGGRMLFLGLGTGLGSALVVDGVVEPLELGHLPFKKKGRSRTTSARRRWRSAARSAGARRCSRSSSGLRRRCSRTTS